MPGIYISLSDYETLKDAKSLMAGPTIKWTGRIVERVAYPSRRISAVSTIEDALAG
jgi:hypothetical protein